MSKSKFSKYNDGVIRIYREKQQRNNFAAKENVSALDDMNFIVRLDYQQVSKRQEDVEFVEQLGRSLSMKVKTRYVKTVDDKCKAVIDNYLYDVVYTDDDRNEMWLYLQGVRKLDT